MKLHTHGKAHFIEFIKDFGDAVGGFLLGLGIVPVSLSLIIIGTVLIFLSLFLRHYVK